MYWLLPSTLVPVWLDPRQLDMVEAGSSSPVAPTFLALEVCSHPAMLPMHALQLSILPARWIIIIMYNNHLQDRTSIITTVAPQQWHVKNANIKTIKKLNTQLFHLHVITICTKDRGVNQTSS
jgi:hypothetical protein